MLAIEDGAPMDWYRDDYVTLGAAAVVTLTSFGYAVHYARQAHPRRAFAWNRPPDLRVAKAVPESTKHAALRAWKTLRMTLAAPVGPSSYAYGGPIPMNGEIVVVHAASWAAPDHAGMHEVWFDEQQCASRGRVSLPLMIDPRRAERVALHEMLRSIGFHPVRPRGHALSRDTAALGDSLQGIAVAFDRSITVH